MIDFFKISLPKHYQPILGNNPLLRFNYNFDKNGEVQNINKKGDPITPRQIAYYKDIKFTLFDSGRTVVEGSIHKYWNNGQHNYNDFDIMNIKVVFNEFLKTFDINPIDARITILEFGVNILPPYESELILHNLFFHKKVPFKWCETQTEGNYYQAKHSLYRIKIYDKSLQYKEAFNIEREILRVEINYKGIELRRQFNVVTLFDLFRTPLELFIDELTKQVGAILFYDFTIKHTSSRLFNYSNKNYWRRFINDKKTSSYNKHRTILNDYINKYSDNVLNQIVEVVRVKGMELSKGGVSIHSIKDVLISTPSKKYAGLNQV